MNTDTKETKSKDKNHNDFQSDIVVIPNLLFVTQKL